MELIYAAFLFDYEEHKDVNEIDVQKLRMFAKTYALLIAMEIRPINEKNIGFDDCDIIDLWSICNTLAIISVFRVSMFKLRKHQKK